jgi:hypothetical protein
MAICDITEYEDLAIDGQGKIIPIGREPATANNPVAIGAEAQSAVFNARTKFIRVHADAACRIEIGLDPEAVDNVSKRIGANGTEYFGVATRDGTLLRASVITTT